MHLMSYLSANLHLPLSFAPKGFTAWSSTRDPSQVFTLLQTIYGEFDGIAKRRKVFKVETIGDCYVAVAGLPNPQSAHAVSY
jgi:class 3 adenylate cyclase